MATKKRSFVFGIISPFHARNRLPALPAFFNPFLRPHQAKNTAPSGASCAPQNIEGFRVLDSRNNNHFGAKPTLRKNTAQRFCRICRQLAQSVGSQSFARRQNIESSNDKSYGRKHEKAAHSER
jgi:hypothetical protein